MNADISDNKVRASTYQLLARLWGQEPGGLLEPLATEPQSLTKTSAVCLSGQRTTYLRFSQSGKVANSRLQ